MLKRQPGGGSGTGPGPIPPQNAAYSSASQWLLQLLTGDSRASASAQVLASSLAQSTLLLRASQLRNARAAVQTSRVLASRAARLEGHWHARPPSPETLSSVPAPALPLTTACELSPGVSSLASWSLAQE